MQTTMEIFIVVAMIALIVQVAILTAMFIQMRKTSERVDGLVKDMQTRVGPILTRVQILLDDTQPKISSMVNDASHVVYLARGQAQKIDRVLTDAADRLRGQLVRADRILTGALEAVEDAGIQMRRSVLQPVKKASALLTGIKVGLDILRSRRTTSGTVPPDEPSEQQEEELLI